MQGQEDLCSYLKTNFEHKNRDQYLELIRQTLSNESQQKMGEIEPVIEDYASQYRNFMHNFNFTANSKANALIEQSLNTVHPGLKTKKECKVILSIMAKIYCQELIEECVEVQGQLNSAVEQPGAVNINNGCNINSEAMNKRNQKKADIDIDILEEAYRRRLMKREQI